MNHDPLESELQSIAPKPLSADFMPQVHARLSSAHAPLNFRHRRLLAASLATAACLAIAALALHESREPTPAHPGPMTTVIHNDPANHPFALDALLQQRPIGETHQRVVRTYSATLLELN
jgi:hypothetical protein